MAEPTGSAPNRQQGPALGRHHRRIAVCWGLGVLSAGFGALNAFYLTGGSVPRGLPGLYDFASATWGDGIALPIMTTALCYTVLILPPSRHERLAASLSAVVSGALGIATQILWLRDDAPRANWTLPRPHHFTAAGWYHAAFLIGMCTLTGALWALALSRLATADIHRRREATKPAATAAVGGAAFIALLAVDASAPTVTSAGQATLYATAIGTLLLVAVAGITARASRSRRSRER